MILSFSCRDVGASGGNGVVSEPWWERNCPANMKSINSVQDFVNEMVLAFSWMHDTCLLALSHLQSEPPSLSADERWVLPRRQLLATGWSLWVRLLARCPAPPLHGIFANVMRACA
jgi:hypothetical protein